MSLFLPGSALFAPRTIIVIIIIIGNTYIRSRASAGTLKAEKKAIAILLRIRHDIDVAVSIVSEILYIFHNVKEYRSPETIDGRRRHARFPRLEDPKISVPRHVTTTTKTTTTNNINNLETIFGTIEND